MYPAHSYFKKSRGIRILHTCIIGFLGLFLVTCSPVLAVDTGSAPGNDLDNLGDVEAFFDSAVPAGLAEYNIPGATVSVVRDGELIFSKGYGYSDIANKTSIDPERTLFHIGSITKLFTWTCVMQMVEEGKIDLDADVNTYLADFSLPDTYPGQPVTMRDLMTHSSGFEEQEVHFAVANVGDLYSFRTYCRENIPARVYPPGTVTSYSNYGTTLAAVIIEDVTGISYEQYLEENILAPLSMTNTHFSYTLPPDSAQNLSSGYHYSGGANIAIPDTVFVIGPAGTISSTATDMAVFLAMHMENGTLDGVEILSEETAVLMHAPAFANDPRVSSMCLGFYENRFNNKRIITHGGDTDTFHSQIVLIPERKSGFFVSYNSPGGNEARNDLLMEYMDHFYPVTGSKKPAQVLDSPAPVGKYTGTYQSTRHNYRSFEFFLTPPQQMQVEEGGEGTIFLMRSGKPASEYLELAPGVFAQSGDKPTFAGNVVFHEDEGGDVDFLCLENIPVFAFERVPWYATGPFTDVLKDAGIAILLTVLLWPLMAICRRVYRIKDEKETAMPFYARMVAGATSVLFIVFVLFLLPAVTGDGALIQSYMWDQTAPPTLVAVLTVPVIAVLLSVVTALFVIQAWRRRYWTMWHRVHYTLVVIGLFMLAWWVNYWNLFFFRL
ncbi:MAG TPA: serine hydrolase domain-containing protein [Methanoregulaceae archaeon]|nr:serine hydrolase domain-containing protein [Methanoregulaceae archaeon]